MNISVELIERFFNKQCTAEEAKHVAAYLKASPVEMDKYLNKSEWSSAQSKELLTGSICEEAWQNIQSKKKRSAAIVWLKNAAVAACIIGVISIGYYKFSYTKPDAHGKALVSNNIEIAKAERKIISNDAKKNMKIILSDSSVVQLSPGAIIEYDVPFKNNKRELFLTGKAMFDVAKNKAKPFTVYAGSLSTTALGTKFTITSEKNNAGNGNINVKLYTGKVVIKSINKNLKGWSKDVYLVPGQQMNYNAENMFVNIEKIKIAEPVKKPVFKNLNKKYEPSADNGLTFTGAALPDVINQLSKYFTVKIEFSEIEIKAMSFTGTINKKDSIGNVLKLIGQMNDLEILQKDQKFVLQKIKKE